MRTLLLLIALALLFPETGKCLQITFKQRAEVSSDYITLGDVAVFDELSPLTEALSTKVVAKSPDPGSSTFLNGISIKKHILRKTNVSRYTQWAGSSVINVSRNGQQIVAQQLINAINLYIQENKHDFPGAEISFKPRSLPLPFVVQNGSLSIEVFPSNPSLVKSSNFSILVSVDGKVRKNLSIQGTLQFLAPVVVVNTSLKRGEILTPTNTSIDKRDLAKHPNPCTNLRNILGKRLKKSLRAGNVISISDVESPPLVQKGQLVKIVVSKGNLHLTATGVARTNGTLNEVIRVQNARSKKLIYCRVAGAGIVQVVI